MERTRIRRLAALAGAAVAAAMVTATALAAAPDTEPFALLSMDQVERMVGKPDVTIVDANPENVYRKHHVPGARWWRSRPLAQLLPAEKDHPVVFYCASPL
jgi:hypothetical protein